MKESNFTLTCVEAELPAIQLDNGTWLFHSYKTVEFAEVSTAINAARWINDNIPKKWTQEFKHPTKKGRPGLYLLLPGFLYTLSQGNSEIALSFRDEVYEVILPSIIQKGGYISPEATKPQLEALQEQVQKQIKAIEQTYDICKESGDERSIITLRSQMINLNNKINGISVETEIEGWLSISEVLERCGYKLNSKKVNGSLSVIGKMVKVKYECETGQLVKQTTKHVGSGHHKDGIKVYPPDWDDKIERIAVDYWDEDRTDKETGEVYNLFDIATA